jgi:uncharacterized protein YdcH (DUF465 family)
MKEIKNFQQKNAHLTKIFEKEILNSLNFQVGLDICLSLEFDLRDNFKYELHDELNSRIKNDLI